MFEMNTEEYLFLRLGSEAMWLAGKRQATHLPSGTELIQKPRAGLRRWGLPLSEPLVITLGSLWADFRDSSPGQLRGPFH